MEECKRMGIKVLGPDINESFYKFAVNKNGEIRFGLGAVKGVEKQLLKPLLMSVMRMEHINLFLMLLSELI